MAGSEADRQVVREIIAARAREEKEAALSRIVDESLARLDARIADLMRRAALADTGGSADASVWSDLAARCEGASGPDRELDEALDGLAHPPKAIPDTFPDGRPIPAGWGRVGAERYTASVDAILALIGEKLPDTGFLMAAHPRTVALVNLCAQPLGEVDNSWHPIARAATPALALCAAFCRAMAALSRSEGKEETRG